MPPRNGAAFVLKKTLFSVNDFCVGGRIPICRPVLRNRICRIGYCEFESGAVIEYLFAHFFHLRKRQFSKRGVAECVVSYFLHNAVIGKADGFESGCAVKSLNCDCQSRAGTECHGFERFCIGKRFCCRLLSNRLQTQWILRKRS